MGVVTRRQYQGVYQVTSIAILLLAACSNSTQPTDQAKIAAAVERLQSGALIDEINAQQKAETNRNEGNEADDIKSFPEPFEPNEPQTLPDPCPNVPKPAKDASPAEFATAAVSFGGCLRTQLAKGEVAETALIYFKTFIPSTSVLLSTMGDEELGALFDTAPEFIAGNKIPSLRSMFRDSDLDEWERLIARRRSAVTLVEASVFAAIDARPALVEYLAKRIDRYALLLALRATAPDRIQDKEGHETCKLVSAALAESAVSVPSEYDLSSFPCEMLHPYGIRAAIPDPKQELEPLSEIENPFRQVLSAVAQLDGSKERAQNVRKSYAAIRDLDNPEIPKHPAAAPGAVRVAFIDSGIDFMTYPELGLFLGDRSGDYSDGDSNPWLPAFEDFSHGSATTASLLTLISHFAPDVLTERKLELSMWKVHSIRSLLSGELGHLGNWKSRPMPIPDAIVEQIESPNEQQPKIVSISMIFTLKKALEKAKKLDVVKKAPWLWVMGAGNESSDVQKDPIAPPCLSDIPDEYRNDSHILCVGALSQGIVEDKIANYSNFGNRVDVYAQESYIKMCAAGTSCATPAVSAAAAVIAAKYPRLTPAQIKKAIVDAAETKTLTIDGTSESTELGVALQRTVKVFNPPSMLGKALEIAKKLAAKPSKKKRR